MKDDGPEKSVYRADKEKEKVLRELKALGTRIVNDLKRGRWPSVELPLRTTKNIVYDADLRQYVLGPKKAVRTLSNIRHVRPFAQMVWLMKFSKQLIESGKTSTLRDTYYVALGENVDFEDQDESDDIILELESVLGHPREDFNIFPEERASIYGDLVIEYTVPGFRGNRVDLSTHPDGYAIGPALTTAEFVRCGAEMVFVIEKGAVFSRFVEERADKKFKALLIHTAGQSPRNCRKLIRRLREELDLPIYVFADADPYGVHIASVLIHGSALSAHIKQLNVPDAIWAGVYATDITKYKLPSMKFTDVDEKRLSELLEDPRYQADPWRREVKYFEKLKRKAELEAFSKYGLEFIVKDFLPERLAELQKR
ncbi:MAG: DNA topoisomerase IV subunit A [Thaumarchaeota archaeon]|nr:DNA topoisomerase IV subunit A [Candidatus Calditenuaceae archaeon]MCX8202799.1 DNA topoisomerase IV subunit A [Nitrososphaeria archaeon]MDW8043548.1 DNA topoisomerase IV subunit A [Nitrososphaerota archaeon]